MNRTSAPAAAALALLLLAGCSGPTAPAGSSSPITSAGSSSPSTGGGTRTVTVFAAASLKATFTTLEQQFEADHQGVDVTINFAGSSDLVTQLQQGAPADVFASADTATMEKATADSLVAGTPVNFATNTLEIAVPPDNPAGITSFADLTKPGLKLVVCAPQVPCGSAAQKIETASGIDLRPVSEESSVTDVLNKVQTGEADAGLVYRTDVRSAGEKVQGIEFPEAAEAVNTYPIAVLSDSQEAELAQEFVDLVTGADGQQVLAAAGFSRP